MDKYEIKLIHNKKECYDFVKEYHYTKMVGAGSKYCFGLFENDILIGVGLWRQPNGRLTYKLFDPFDLKDNSSILDLTRLCLIDDTRKNTESFFLSKMIKWIKTNDKDIDFLITYADYNQGHSGVIYRASNWIPFGTGGDNRKVYNVDEDGRLSLTSSRWLKDKKNKTITLKIKKKFRFVFPLKIKRKKYLKIIGDKINTWILLHSKLKEEYDNEKNFSLKEGIKYLCRFCNKIYDEEDNEECEFCNHLGCNNCIIYDDENNYLCEKCI
jgi:hypothetical protein